MDKEDVAHTYNGVLFSHQSEMMSFVATAMDVELIMLSEESQKEEDIYIYMSSHSMCNLRYNTNELTYDTETDSQT